MSIALNRCMSLDIDSMLSESWLVTGMDSLKVGFHMQVWRAR